jgi:hypothetical protein
MTQPTDDSSEAKRAAVERGRVELARLRRVYWLGFLVLLAGILVLRVTSARVPRWGWQAFVAAWVFAELVALYRLRAFRCPRCGARFNAGRAVAATGKTCTGCQLWLAPTAPLDGK